MFRRRDSHKPSVDLLASFKKQFPTLPTIVTDSKTASQPLATPIGTSKSDLDSDQMSFDPRHFGFEETPEDTITPQGSYRPSTTMAATSSFSYGPFVDFSPSWQQSPDSGSFYTNQMQYSWPSSYQPGILTPSSRSLSLPSSIQAAQPAFLNMQDVHLQPTFSANPLEFSAYQQFSPQLSGHTSYKTARNPLQHQTHQIPTQQSSSQPHFSLESTDFRFHASLLNGTAMVKDEDVPVSYLNKRQTYKILIRDTRAEQRSSVPTTYRTYIRISFHDDKQRMNPGQHWQLWKEGRGMNEAQQHGGRLQAIEYVPTLQSSGQSARVHLEKDSFDSFCVNWTAPNSFPPECELQFRCNFLSTDFSRSKGVKGIPVRLCAKTEAVGLSNMMAPPPSLPEICYCKIKLFRDHGAERKLTNDEAALRRLIAKTEEQIKQSQAANEDDYTKFDSSGKRRVSEVSPSSVRPHKYARFQRASSLSSEGSSQGQDIVEGDLPVKLGNLNRVLRSKRDITLMSLRGEELDDPDLHPVTLPEAEQTAGSPESKRLDRRSTQVSESSAQSPRAPTIPVSPSLHGHLQVPSPVASHPSNEWVPDLKKEVSADSTTSNPQHLASPPKGSSTVTQVKANRPGVTLDAVDVDPSYKAPEPKALPVACFYLQMTREGVNFQEYHRAIYLYERTLDAFIEAVARKRNLAKEDITGITYTRLNGDIQVTVDDDFVEHMPEGQDMVAEFTPAERGSTRRSQTTRFSLQLKY